MLTREKLATNAADRWEKQYHKKDYGGQYWYDKRKERIHKELKGLKDPTPEKVDGIIGNGSWTRVECSLCEKEVNAVYVFEDDSNYMTCCKKCLDKKLTD